MSHLLYQTPGRIRVSLLKLFGELVYCFTDNLDIVNGGMKPQSVFFQLLLTKATGVLLNTIYGRQNIFQSGKVSFRLSHILKLYHG